MDADWSVELGAGDSALEFPWASPEGTQRYVDLRLHPEHLSAIPEATQFPELANFLRAINNTQSLWLTAKCDVWLDDELGGAEVIYEAKQKLGSYVDLVFRDKAARFSLDRHEVWVKQAARDLSTDDELPAACEFVVRRCWYHPEATPERAPGTASSSAAGPVPGFYVTCYLFGYGNDEPQARARWAEGLRRVTTVLAALAP